MFPMKKSSETLLMLLGLGLFLGFLYGLFDSIFSVISNQYVHYRMYNLVLFTFQDSINKSITLITVAIVGSYFIIFPLYYMLKLTKRWVNVTLVSIDFNFRNKKKCIDLSITLLLSLTVYIWGGYLINYYLLPEFFSIKSVFGNIGILFFVICFILLLRMIFSKIDYYKIAKLFVRLAVVKNIDIKYVKIYCVITVSSVLLFNACIIALKKTNIPEEPNVILIGVDTLRADHLGSYKYGKNISPNIDYLAREGILFENAFSQASWTLPAFASILTSLYPAVHGATDERRKLSRGFITLGEILQENFYETGAVVSGMFVSSEYGFKQGFGLFEEIRPLNDIKISSPLIYEKAAKFIEKNRNNRFFLFLHFYDPHARYFLHEEYDYDANYDGSLKGGGKDISVIRELLGTFSERDLSYLKSVYDSEISFTDKYIGKVLDKLEKLGLSNNTVIIVTSDHGEEFRERGWWGHGRTLYNELIHVPLILKIPGVKEKGKRIDTKVGTIDIMSAIMEICKLNMKGGMELQGENLLNIIENDHNSHNFKIFGDHKRFKSIIHGDWKLIKDIKKNSFELYNIKDDTLEMNNIVNDHPGIVRELTGYLEKWEENNRMLSENNRPPEEKVIRNGLKEKLKDLGYLN